MLSDSDIPPFDFSGRDVIADSEAETILSTLPENHPARLAFAQAAHTTEIARLVDDREIVEALMAIHRARNERIFRVPGREKV